MAFGRLVFGFASIFGPVIVWLLLLNRRDARLARLHHSVLDQLVLPNLRGRIAVQIRCSIFLRKSTVSVDLLAGTPHEVWEVFTRLAAHLPPRARLRVRGTIGRQLVAPFTLETVTRHMPSRPLYASLVTS